MPDLFRVRPVREASPMIHLSKVDGHRCRSCDGTGVDRKKTDDMYRREPSSTGYVWCWFCLGNGLDPTEYFRWSK